MLVVYKRALEYCIDLWEKNLRGNPEPNTDAGRKTVCKLYP